MYSRKQLKKEGRRSFKKHYLLFIVICLIAGFLGTEYIGALGILKNDVSTYEEKSYDMVVEERLPLRGIAKPPLGIASLIKDIYDNNIEEGEKTSKELIKEYRKKNSGILGRSSGIFAKTLNVITSGDIVIRLAQAIDKVVNSYKITAVIIVIISFLFFFLLWMLVQNTFVVISRRLFLEGCTYEKVPFSRFTFLKEVRCWWRASLTMLLVTLYKYLWALTIIGGIIKRYSYFMVPYIVAENPKVTPRKAIKLSRKMMKGHKWECFKFELSFIGWLILGVFTLGISEILYSNPYRIAALCKYYTYIREKTIENNIEGNEILNNRYLFEIADEKLLAEEYPEADEKAIEEAKQGLVKNQSAFKKVLDFFGVMIRQSDYEEDYEAKQEAALRAKRVMNARNGLVYPTRLGPIQVPENGRYIDKAHYIRHYSIYSLIIIFFAFSFIGWCWEVSYCSLSSGIFANRGALHGPWLPIYGSGGIAVLVILNKLRQRPVIEFFSIIVLCGIIEYYTSYFMEKLNDGVRWWDYTGAFLNLDGRICAEGLLLFAIGGMAAVYIIAPRLDNIIRKLNPQRVVPICLALMVCFAVDLAYSAKNPNEGEGITSQITVLQENAKLMETDYDERIFGRDTTCKKEENITCKDS